MKILIDMNLSPRWVSFFAERGITSAHWSAIGAPDVPDSAIMAFASAHDYVIFTYDLDFSAILAATKGGKPSVVQIRGGNISPEAIGETVIAALDKMREPLAAGALVTIEPNRARLRILPLSTGGK